MKDHISRLAAIAMLASSALLVTGLVGLASYALGAGDLIDNLASWALAHGW